MEEEFLRVVLTRGDIITKRNEKGHQGYELSLRFSRNSFEPMTSCLIFDRYRTLKGQLEGFGVGLNLAHSILSEFPATFTGSAMGLSMTEDQLRQRTFLLSKWVVEIVTSYSSFPEPAQRAIDEFLEIAVETPQAKLARALLSKGLVNKPKPSPSATSASSTKEAASSNRAVSVRLPDKANESGISRSVSMAGPNPRRESLSSLVAQSADKESPHTVLGAILEVYVVFGKLAPKSASDSKVHVTYEACVGLVQPSSVLISVAYPFDTYRTLHKDLGSIGISLDGFPPTQSRSTFGFSLSKEQLTERCLGLNRWIGAVLKNFDGFLLQGKILVQQFFRIQENDPVQSHILAILNKSHSEGTLDALLVAAGLVEPPPAIPPVVEKKGMFQMTGSSSAAAVVTPPPPSIAPAPATPTVAPNATTNAADQMSASIGATLKPTKLLGNSAEVTVCMGELPVLVEEDGKLHVVYETRIKVFKPQSASDSPAASDICAESEVTHTHVSSSPFRAYSNLRDDLLKLDVGKGVSFSKSYHKSRLGLALTIEQLEERVSTLNSWMGAILSEYPVMSKEAQRVLVSFLQPIDPAVLSVLAGNDEDIEAEEAEDSFPEEPATVFRPPPTTTAPPTRRESSRRGSVRGGGSVAGFLDSSTYSEVGMDNIPTQLTERLQCTVFLGSLAPKVLGEKKMHLTYQSTLSLGSVDPNVGPTLLSVVAPFDGYRQLSKELAKLGLDQFPEPFPPTYSQSALGVALSRDQVQERSTALNLWMGAVIKKFPGFSKDGKAAVLAFFAASTEKDAAIIQEMESISAAAINMKDDGSEADGKSVSGFTNATQFVRSIDPVSVGNDNPPTSIGPVQVSVTLGSLAGKHDTDTRLHLTYQITLRLIVPADSQPVVHFVAYTFDAFRKLQEELAGFGVATDIEFAKSYPKSKLGISLSKDEIADRVSTLNRWVGAVLMQYPSFPQNCQMAISDFIDIDSNENAPSNVILKNIHKFGNRAEPVAAGSSGGQASTPGTTAPEVTSTGNLRAAVAAGTPPALIHDWILVQVLFKDTGSANVHAYETILRFREFNLEGEVTSVRHTVAYPFDRYRQLESDLAAIGVGKDKACCSISVPFPETFTQSSFGISLSTPQLISRCTKLHSWMAAVLVSFHSFPRAAQTLVVGFLQLDNPPAPIKDVIIDIFEEGPSKVDSKILADINAIYAPPPPPPPPPPATGSKSKRSTNADGSTKPTGCCIIS